MRGLILKKFIQGITLLSQPTGTTVDELERRLGSQNRQVYRFLATIKDDFGFILDEEKLDGGGKRFSLATEQCKSLSDVKVLDLNLNVGEVVALHFLRGHAKLFKGTDIGDGIERAFTKLGAFIPDGLADKLERVRSLFVPSVRFAKDYAGKEALIESLSEAILGQHTCVVEYHSFADDKTKKYQIDPLRFFERDGGLYLFVRATRFGDIRVLAVERIVQIEATDSAFVYPIDFDPEALLDRSFGMFYDDPLEVKIWFSAGQAPYVRERQWAQEQTITEQKDGSIVLWMKTSGWYDVKKWVLSFGAEAQVLEPAHLQDKVKNEVEKMLRGYGVNIIK
ncbi:MAG: WYL domain-containing protein [Deltaproteobacteria bacterium]|nr:WYL domain-containing protein [Deltaproteobacteria bacterium]